MSTLLLVDKWLPVVTGSVLLARRCARQTLATADQGRTSLTGTKGGWSDAA